MAKQFDGIATIRVNFRNRPEYEKFRKYVLRTGWSYALDYPLFEEMTFKFAYTSDVEKISKTIVSLLQMGFDVYCCRFELKQYKSEPDPDLDVNDEDTYIQDDPDIQRIVDDMWRDFVTNGSVRN